jgi:hypothetical protein
MMRTLLHLLATLCLLVCVAGGALWVRAGDAGDYFGWKRESADGRDWVREEWSARSHAGRLLLLSSRSTTGPTSQGPAKAHIRNPEEGYFWKPVVEKAPAKKPEEATLIDIQRTGPRPTTAPATAAAAAAATKPFVMIDETTPASRARGASMSHWLFVAVTGGLPVLWFAFAALGRRKGGESGDRISAVARLFSTVASLSILLAFALGLLWAKSWYMGDRVSWRDPNRPQFVDVHSGKGELVVHFRRVDERLARSATDLAGAANGFTWRQDADSSVGYTTKTFCFEHENRVTAEGANRGITVAAPYWFLMIVALVLPTWWLRNQKHGPIKVTSFGRPAGGKGRLIHGTSSSQRPI